MAGDDPFADLGISKPSNNKVGVSYGVVKDDPVIATSYDSSSSLSKPPSEGKGEPMRKDAAGLRDPAANAMDVAVTTALDRILRRIMPKFEEFMEETTRRLHTIESRCETIDQALVDLREVSGVRDETVKERLYGVERQLREVTRGVQLVRDKQELQEAQAELAKLTVKKEAPALTESDPAASTAAAAAVEAPASAATPVIVQPSAPSAPSAPPAAAAPAAEVLPAAVASAPTPSAPPAVHVTAPVAADAVAPAAQPAAIKSAEPDPAVIKAAVEAAMAAARQTQQPSGPAQPAPSAVPSASAPAQHPAVQHSVPPPQHSVPPPQQLAPPPPPPPMQQPPPPPPAGSHGPPPGPPQAAPGMPPPPPHGPGPAGYTPAHYRTNLPGPPVAVPGAVPGPPPPGTVMPPHVPQGPQSYPPRVPDYPAAPAPGPGALQGGIYGPPPPTMVPQYSARPYAAPAAPRMGGNAPVAPQRSYSSTSSQGGPVPAGTSTKTMSVQTVVNEVANMGFPPYQVRQVIDELADQNLNIDLNVVIDRLTNGTR